MHTGQPEKEQTEEERQHGGGALGIFDAQLIGSLSTGDLKGAAAAMESAIAICVCSVYILSVYLAGQSVCPCMSVKVFLV